VEDSLAILKRNKRMSLKLMTEIIMRESMSSMTILWIFSVIMVNTRYDNFDYLTADLMRM